MVTFSPKVGCKDKEFFAKSDEFSPFYAKNSPIFRQFGTYIAQLLIVTICEAQAD